VPTIGPDPDKLVKRVFEKIAHTGELAAYSRASVEASYVLLAALASTLPFNPQLSEQRL